MFGDRHFTLEELCALYEMNKQQIHDYIHQGLVDPPYGSVRAYYTQKHVEQLLAIHKRRQAGLPPDFPSTMGLESGMALQREPYRLGKANGQMSLVVDHGVKLYIHPSSGLSAKESHDFLREVCKLYRIFKRRRRTL